MNYKSIPQAARLLGVPERKIRRAIRSGALPYLEMGARQVVDVDQVREALRHSVGIHEVSDATGLTEHQVRRGIRDGWIPAWMDGTAWAFDLDEVLEAINKRLK